MFVSIIYGSSKKEKTGMQSFQTTWPLFLTILVGYLALSLVLGAKSIYFEPFKGKEEEKPESPKVPEVVSE